MSRSMAFRFTSARTRRTTRSRNFAIRLLRSFSTVSSSRGPVIVDWKDIADGSDAPAVSAAEFDREMKALKLEVPLAVAVSGGSDSMALAHLAAEWTLSNDGAKKKETKTKLFAFTVDHRFRPESAVESQLVHSWLTERYSATRLHHEILAIDWGSELPSDGQKQSRGREERFRLLSSACRANRVRSLLTAHQREDQIDTFLMRLGRMSGNVGLGGIRSIVELPDGIQLVRPMLSFSRDRLKATCKRFQQSYIHDPSNDSDVYLRTRVRSIRQSLLGKGVPAESLESLMSFLRESTAKLNRDVNSAASQLCEVNSALGYTKVSLKELIQLPDTVLYHLLERLIVCYTPITHTSASASSRGQVNDSTSTPLGRYSIPHRAVLKLVNLLKTKKSEVVHDGWGVTIGTCYIFRRDGIFQEHRNATSKTSRSTTYLTFTQSHEDKRIPIPSPIRSGVPLKWRGWTISYESRSRPDALVSVCSPNMWIKLVESDKRLKTAKSAVNPVLRQSLPVIHEPEMDRSTQQDQQQQQQQQQQHSKAVGDRSTRNLRVTRLLAMPALRIQSRDVTRSFAEYTPDWPVLKSTGDSANELDE